MLKKVAFALVAGGLVFAAQGASADDTQFWTGKTYQGVSALPFDAFSTEADARSDAIAPKAAQEVERLTPRESGAQMVVVPAPYDTDAGYFN